MQAAELYRARARDLGIARQSFGNVICTFLVPLASPQRLPLHSVGITHGRALHAALKLLQPVCHTLSSSCEITLLGHVLPVGGVKEKILAARRAGVAVRCAAEESPDLRYSPQAPSGLRFVFARTIDEVLAVALAAHRGTMRVVY